MADRAQLYQDKLDEIVRTAVSLPQATRAELVRQLAEAARAINAELARTDLGSFPTARLRALKAEVERTMASFSQQASADIAKAQRTMFTDAARNVDATVAVALPNVAVHPVVDVKMLAVAQNYTADLVTNVSQQTAAKINLAIQRAALGGSTMTQLVQQIGGALEGGEFSGYFSEAGARAQTIATNEILRIHSLASMARLTDLSSRHKGVQKEWLHIPAARVPRPGHILASGQTRPVDQPFDVEGEELMYPRDPSGSADNTINCHCLVRPKLDQALLQPTDQEKAALAKHGISITTQRS